MNTLNTALRRLPAWAVYLAGFAYAAWLFWLGLTGGLGVEPIKALEHAYGDAALKLLVLALAVTPLRAWAGLNLMKFRRAIGLTCFFFACCHLAVWLFLDVQAWGQILADIAKRPYVAIGMAGFLLLLPLALTSNNASVRRLGPAWRRLQRLAYPAGLCGALHYVWLAKGFQIEPLVYLGLICTLLLLRLPKIRNRAAA